MTDFADLIEGYHRFRKGDWVEQRERWSELAEAQHPKVLVIGCSDSRVDPAQIFDVAPGEIFVVRNVANLVPPFETTAGYHGVSAALEFAVTQLEVPEIVVIGHGSCGGVNAALHRSFKDAEPGQGGFISDWIGLLDEARDKVESEDHEEPGRALEWEAVRTSLKNLHTFPFVQERLDAGSLKLYGAWFAIKGGELRVMDGDGAFQPA